MRAVLWDLDDTVLDTLQPRMSALKHAYEQCVGGWVDPEALWRSHRGGTLEDLGKRLLGDDFRRFTTTYRDRYYADSYRVQAFPGVEEVLGVFRDHGLELAIVTSKVSWGATEELERAGLLPYFVTVVGFDDTDTHKPDPEPLFEAMDRLVIDDPTEVMFVGDSPADIFAAHNAGVLSVAATWGTLDEETLLDAGPKHVARRPADVFDALRILAPEGAR